MQSNSIYLYPNAIDVYPNVAQTWTQERTRQVYSRNIKIYRSVDNRIDLTIRSGDQKPLNVSNNSFVFNMVERENNDLIIRKDCSFDDATKGRAYVTLTREELQDIKPGNYDFSITKETRQNNSVGYNVTKSETTYLDTQYGSIGTIEVYGDLLGYPYDTQTIKTFNKIINFNNFYGVDGDPAFDLPRPNYARHTPTSGYEEYWVSSIVDGKPNETTTNSLHTFQIYLNAYAGELVLQGSLDEGAKPIEENWVDLKNWTLTTSDSDFFYNQIGKYNWFRFKHTPLTTNTGTVDKVLYR